MKLDSAYIGKCHNLTGGVFAPLRLVFSDVASDHLRGELTVGEPLSGSGPFEGTRDGDAIKLTSGRESRMYIIWRGVLSGKNLTGKYMVYNEGLALRLMGVNSLETGTFECTSV